VFFGGVLAAAQAGAAVLSAMQLDPTLGVIAAVQAVWSVTLASRPPAVQAIWSVTLASLVPAVQAIWSVTLASLVPAVQAIWSVTLASLVPAVQAIWSVTLASLVPAVQAIWSVTLASLSPAVQAVCSATLASLSAWASAAAGYVGGAWRAVLSIGPGVQPALESLALEVALALSLAVTAWLVVSRRHSLRRRQVDVDTVPPLTPGAHIAAAAPNNREDEEDIKTRAAAKEGITTLAAAVEEDNTTLFASAEEHFLQLPIVLNTPALFWATAEGDVDEVGRLIAAGGDVNEVMDDGGGRCGTPLFIAARDGNVAGALYTRPIQLNLSRF